ncbi:kinase-like domain-containing protein [Flagelloscypha sp. PMI_526]|nr:kinase-like domain-containing protein [Flagelloscypha sp. PMI_526]
MTTFGIENPTSSSKPLLLDQIQQFLLLPRPHQQCKRPLKPHPSPPSPSKPNRRNVTSNGSTFQNQSETTWAPRPAPEDVFEQLEKFFPNHDIDEPVFEADSGAGSPVNGDIPAPLPTVAPLVPNKAKKNNLANKKSLRMAAGEQYNKKRISHEPRRVSRRMTRLWGSKLEEVTTKDSRVSLSTTPESPGSSSGASTFKWVRGELIGRGTYGRVYLALNATTGEMIAVKQVEIPQTASDMYDTRQSTVVQALKSESETLKDLDHPNIVQYLGFEETPANLSIFLEYVPGGSIGSCLLRHGKFDEPVTKHFTSQILDGLHYLHSKNILHRDLKADNILVEHGGVCKISDFGISKRMTDDLSGGAQTAMQGTVFWMAPEVISTAEKGYNSKVDIWSVGCVVLEMWAGSRPWSGSEMMAVMFKLYHEKKPPPIPENVTLTELADDFRKLCFAINPDDRPPASVLRKHPYLELPPHWQFTGKFGSRNS